MNICLSQESNVDELDDDDLNDIEADQGEEESNPRGGGAGVSGQPKGDSESGGAGANKPQIKKIVWDNNSSESGASGSESPSLAAVMSGGIPAISPLLSQPQGATQATQRPRGSRSRGGTRGVRGAFFSQGQSRGGQGTRTRARGGTSWRGGSRGGQGRF